MTVLVNKIFQAVSLKLSFGYNTLMTFLIYGSNVPKNLKELFDCINSLNMIIKITMDYSARKTFYVSL